MVKTTKKIVKKVAKKVKISSAGKKVNTNFSPLAPKGKGKLTLHQPKPCPFEEELEQYCKANSLCQVINSGDGWAIVCKLVQLDVRVTAQGNSAFQPYSSENNPYHKVKEVYGVMAAISWGYDGYMTKDNTYFWLNFPDIYTVKTEGQITHYLDKLGR